MSKTVYDVKITVKSAHMHVLASNPQEAFEIAEQHLDDWYNDYYFENEFYIDDEPETVSATTNVYLDKEENDPLYGSKKYKTLGEYINADDDDDDDDDEEEQEYQDPHQLSLDF